MSLRRSLKVLLVHADSGMSVGGVVLASAGAALGCGVMLLISDLHALLVAAVALLAGAAMPYRVCCGASARGG